MQKYLPSRQFVRTILGTLVLGLVVFLIGKLFVNETVAENKNAKNTTSANKGGDFFSLDTDGDGLYDWEEALWGTDPFIKDSKGDGVSDYEYVKSRRKDFDVDSTYKPDKNNETEVFAKQLFTTASVLNQSGTFSQDTVEQFSQGFNNSISNFNIKNKYTLANLKLSNITVLEYNQKLVDLYAGLEKPEVNELTLIAYMMENPNDEFAIEDLGVYLAYTDSLVNGLIGMSVPNSNAGLHLSFVNNIYKISEIMRNVVYLDQDPLKFASYISKYNEHSESFTRDLESFKVYFSSNGII